MKWERREVDSNTGESIGRCESEHPIAYVLPLVFILLLPTCLTAWFAYKTKDVDEAYTESWWIFVMVLVQIEVSLTHNTSKHFGSLYSQASFEFRL